MKPVMHGKLCMLQRFKSQRGMCEPCARSLKVSGILRERAQARCVVATTVLPHSCRVGRALLHPGRHLGLGEGTTSVARVPSVSQRLCQLSKPSPHLPWHYNVHRAYESPKTRGDGKGGWWTSRFRGPSLATKGVLGGTP